MKRKIKMLASCVLATVISSGCLVACNPFESGEGIGDKIDNSMSQLYVSNYNGGFGSEWVYEAKARFEEVYKDYSFEPDKKGVQIIVRADKIGFAGAELYKGMEANKNEVFFTQAITYMDYVNDGYMLDISDLLNDTDKYNTLDPNNDGKTIASKMYPEQLSYFDVKGKSYAIPHYLGASGIIYDMDLFHKKSLYYARNGVQSENYASDKDTYGGFNGTVSYTNYVGNRSAGPDGKHGTYDDGLPATYDEFFALCSYMSGPAKGVQPFTMTGQYADTYIYWLLAALMADYEGKEQTLLNATLNGTAENLVTVSGNSIVKDTSDTPISASNGYELTRQAGRYHSLYFLEKIKSYFDNKSWADEDSHVSAQTRYLRSSSLNEGTAFLVEGVWWENEAEATFTEMAKADEAYSRMNRKFGFLPLPKVSNEQIGDSATLLDSLYSCAFINGNIDESKIDLAKTFLKFCCTDYSLEQYTIQSGTIKAFNYDISETAKTKLSGFSKSYWELYKSDNCEVIYQLSNNDIFRGAQDSFEISKCYKTTFGTGAFTSIVKQNKTAAEYFKGMIDYNSKEKWDSNFSK